MSVEIRILKKSEQNILKAIAKDVFDHAVDQRLAREFLRDPRHHIAVAIEGGLVVGFASGVHYVHPDKRPELWINEVAVSPKHRKKGVGKRLLRALLRLGGSLGCKEAWVLTDRFNRAAVNMYASIGGVPYPHSLAMFTFDLPQRKRK